MPDVIELVTHIQRSLTIADLQALIFFSISVVASLFPLFAVSQYDMDSYFMQVSHSIQTHFAEQRREGNWGTQR